MIFVFRVLTFVSEAEALGLALERKLLVFLQDPEKERERDVSSVKLLLIRR